MRHFRFLACAVIGVLFGAGCTPIIPKDALQLQHESLQQRQLQTRYYETTDEMKILVAATALFQDLGFSLSESETKLGVVTGIKQRDAVNAGQVTAAVVVALLGGGVMHVDKEQTMRVSFVTRPLQNNRVAVRVTFQRVVINTQNRVTTQEALTDPGIYTEFYDKLSKAIFLEAHQL